MNYKKKKNMFFKHFVATPFIFILIIPLVIFDVFVELYHQIGFRLYGIKLVNRSSYIKIDRHKLKYLNIFNKIGCAYCGYANGFANYLVKICAETEKYWCGIKHKKSKEFIEPKHHKKFVEYGNEKEYKKRYE